MLPFLLIILHFSQIGFTDDLTFTATASLPKKSNCNYSTIFSIWQALFKNSFIIYFYGRRYKKDTQEGDLSIFYSKLQEQAVLSALPTIPALPATRAYVASMPQRLLGRTSCPSIAASLPRPLRTACPFRSRKNWINPLPADPQVFYPFPSTLP